MLNDNTMLSDIDPSQAESADSAAVAISFALGSFNLREA